MLTILGNFVNFYFERKKFKIDSNYVSELEKNYERFCVLKFVLWIKTSLLKNSADFSYLIVENEKCLKYVSIEGLGELYAWNCLFSSSW